MQIFLCCPLTRSLYTVQTRTCFAAVTYFISSPLPFARLPKTVKVVKSSDAATATGVGTLLLSV